MQAGFDQKETEREAKLKETMSNLQRIFPGPYKVYSRSRSLCSRVPGVRGRLVDLCKPTQRKYEAAISVILGRNIDAVVVDEERTAIDCIEVRFLPFSFDSARWANMLCCGLVYAQPACGPGDIYSARHDSSETDQRQVPRVREGRASCGRRDPVRTRDGTRNTPRVWELACLRHDGGCAVRLLREGSGGQRCARRPLLISEVGMFHSYQRADATAVTLGQR